MRIHTVDFFFYLIVENQISFHKYQLKMYCNNEIIIYLHYTIHVYSADAHQ